MNEELTTEEAKAILLECYEQISAKPASLRAILSSINILADKARQFDELNK